MIIKTSDGEELDISIDQIEALGESEDPTKIPGVQDRINDIAGKTRKEAQKSTRKQLLESDDFWKESASKRGVELRDSDLRPKGASAGETAKLRERVDKLKEKAARADTLEEEIKASRTDKLKNKLLQRADGVKDDLKDVFLSYSTSRFGFDEDDGTHVPLGDEGQLDYTRTVDDVISEIKDDKPSLFKKAGATSTGTSPGADGGSQKTYTEAEVSRLMTNAASLSDEEYNSVMTAVRNGRVVQE